MVSFAWRRLWCTALGALWGAVCMCGGWLGRFETEIGNVGVIRMHFYLMMVTLSFASALHPLSLRTDRQ